MEDPQLRHASALFAEGWTSYRLQKAIDDNSLIRLTRSVYAPVMELSPRQEHLRRMAALLSNHGDSVVASHVSAAIAHGLAVPSEAAEAVHLTVPPPARGRRSSGYHLHAARLDATDVVTRGTLRVTSLARTIVDLARTSSFTWGVVAADQALGLGVSRLELLASVEASRGRTGVQQARRVVEFADSRSESVAESVSRVTISRTGLPQPVPQLSIQAGDEVVARGDFGWEEWKLVGEMDGKVKYRSDNLTDRSPEEVMAAQNYRQERIRQAGFWVTRWGWRAAWNVGTLRDLLGTALRHQGWRP